MNAAVGRLQLTSTTKTSQDGAHGEALTLEYLLQHLLVYE